MAEVPSGGVLMPSSAARSLGVYLRYFEGKKRAEEAVVQSFPSSGTLIKPTFIYGGDAFELTPPRVSDGYGAAIDTLLSSAPVRAIAGISPGPIKVLAFLCRRRGIS